VRGRGNGSCKAGIRYYDDDVGGIGDSDGSVA
jgi:hypothetical protein